MQYDVGSNPAAMYLRLAEGPDDLLDDRRSGLHRAFAIFAVIVYLTIGFLLSMGLVSPDWAPWKPDSAIAASGPDDDGEDDDEDEDEDHDGKGDDDAVTDLNSGRESAGNTDAGGHDTGVSTRGETDPGDHTGKTERTQGTGQESRGATDAPGAHTGASTAGETDPGDHTGKTERR